MAQQDFKLENFEERLKSIEQRLTKLESEQALNKFSQPSVEAEELQTAKSSSLSEAVIDEETGLESRIGRVGLAWLGNFVLLSAIIFFTEYIITAGSWAFICNYWSFLCWYNFFHFSLFEKNKFKPVVSVKNK